MKERMAYSPKVENASSHLDINFKKSPHKFVVYDSAQRPPEVGTH